MKSILPAVVLATILSSIDGATLETDAEDSCICTLLDRPNVLEKEKRARWMVHSLNFGVLSTISSRLPDQPPFGNVYSFVDGLCNTSSGVPYFYGTYMDQSFKDSKENPSASFTLSEASLPSLCAGKDPIKACASHTGLGDPENPICARLTLTGKLVEVPSSTKEYEEAKNALLQRHPVMQHWPTGHNWIVAKLEIEDIWFIDYFGGASILSVDDYFSVNLFPSTDNEG